MPSAQLVSCLRQLWNEFDDIAPNRDRRSDGWIGDAAHAGSSSDHNPDETGKVPIRDADKINEVHALDVDKDLNVPGLDMERVVQFLLTRCRNGTERRLRYIIWNRRIWEASNGWRQRTYTGANAHDQHGHFSASYDTALEASKASWRLEDIPVALTDADLNKIGNMIASEVAKAVTAARNAELAVNALTRARPLNGPDGKPDGTQYTPLGHNVLMQGVPSPAKGGARVPMHELLGDIAEAVVES
ncbi:hypothetical protein [Brevundimonas sp.]|uniref:hypothetical protein n=1 Tax=Brevundimonas sp. TaxID=1871086 RepID=UPI002D3CCBC9|nr:hypothetical protein [Brevundimonas sp.]HYD28889.1 hypothetical protein [Brevundimonas sp.]